ncbi:MAG: hypothetical protein ACYDH5_03290, partial [Acidimicrobiales bacterium]
MGGVTVIEKIEGSVVAEREYYDSHDLPLSELAVVDLELPASGPMSSYIVCRPTSWSSAPR